MKKTTTTSGSPPSTGARNGPDLKKAMATAADLGKKLGCDADAALALARRFIRTLEIRLGEPFSRKPGYRWLPGRARPGTWALSPSDRWTMLYFRPSLPPPKRSEEFWAYPKNFWKRRLPLTLTQVMRHLLGHEVRGQHRPLQTRIAIVDIDPPDDKSEKPWKRRSVVERYRALMRALGKNVPHVVVRSSGREGIHVYFRFDRVMEGPEIRAAMVARLRAAGLPVEPGIFEVFPHGERTFRFPLGDGSILLAPKTLKRWSPGEKFSRADEITAFLNALEALRIDVGDLRPVSKRCAHQAKNAAPRPLTKSLLTTARVSPNKLADIEKVEKFGITSFGRRNDEAFALVRDWRVRRCLSRKVIRARFEEWLKERKHRSTTFRANKDFARRQLLAALDPMLDRIDAWVLRSNASFSPYRGDSLKPRYLSLFSYRDYLFHLGRQQGHGGKALERHALRQWTYEEDRARWRDEPRWLSNRLTKLVALLRFAQERNHVQVMALDSKALHNICGHGEPPPELAAIYLSRTSGRPRRSAYPVVVRAAERFRLIKFVKNGVKDVHGAVYRLTLPPLASPSKNGARS